MVPASPGLISASQSDPLQPQIQSVQRSQPLPPQSPGGPVSQQQQQQQQQSVMSTSSGMPQASPLLVDPLSSSSQLLQDALFASVNDQTSSGVATSAPTLMANSVQTLTGGTVMAKPTMIEQLQGATIINAPTLGAGDGTGLLNMNLLGNGGSQSQIISVVTLAPNVEQQQQQQQQQQATVHIQQQPQQVLQGPLLEQLLGQIKTEPNVDLVTQQQQQQQQQVTLQTLQEQLREQQRQQQQQQQRQRHQQTQQQPLAPKTFTPDYSQLQAFLQGLSDQQPQQLQQQQQIVNQPQVISISALPQRQVQIQPQPQPVQVAQRQSHSVKTSLPLAPQSSSIETKPLVRLLKSELTKAAGLGLSQPRSAGDLDKILHGQMVGERLRQSSLGAARRHSQPGKTGENEFLVPQVCYNFVPCYAVHTMVFQCESDAEAFKNLVLWCLTLYNG